ncbi:hypothetical protein SALBM311S_07623 [Streptomyces alboniger]
MRVRGAQHGRPEEQALGQRSAAYGKVPSVFARSARGEAPRPCRGCSGSGPAPEPGAPASASILGRLVLVALAAVAASPLTPPPCRSPRRGGGRWALGSRGAGGAVVRRGRGRASQRLSLVRVGSLLYAAGARLRLVRDAGGVRSGRRLGARLAGRDDVRDGIERQSWRQRQRLPQRAWRVSSSVGAWLPSSRSWTVIAMPGMQKPHWTAPQAARARWTSEGSPSTASPSTVRTSLPAVVAAGTRQEATSRPSTWTLQAPHSPCEQPSLAPARPRRSRSTYSRDSPIQAWLDRAVHAVHVQDVGGGGVVARGVEQGGGRGEDRLRLRFGFRFRSVVAFRFRYVFRCVVLFRFRFRSRPVFRVRDGRGLRRYRPHVGLGVGDRPVRYARLSGRRVGGEVGGVGSGRVGGGSVLRVHRARRALRVCRGRRVRRVVRVVRLSGRVVRRVGRCGFRFRGLPRLEADTGSASGSGSGAGTGYR